MKKIECKVCGHAAHFLEPHIQDAHGMTVKEYLAAHPDAPVMSKAGAKRFADITAELVNPTPATQTGGAICGYARVSTRGQKLDAQLEALKAKGVDDEHLWQEKASGAKDDRPELAALLKFVRKGDTIIATKLDRLARSTRHLLEIVETLEKKGVALKVLNINLDTSSPTGKLMLTMLAGIAQFERELMLERQAEGFAVAKEAGRIKGRPSTAQAKAAEVQQLAKAGLTKKAIAEQLGIGQASVYRLLREARQ